jgi:hypothetical protein
VDFIERWFGLSPDGGDALSLDTQLRCVKAGSDEALVKLLLHLCAGTARLEGITRCLCHRQT